MCLLANMMFYRMWTSIMVLKYGRSDPKFALKPTLVIKVYDQSDQVF